MNFGCDRLNFQFLYFQIWLSRGCGGDSGSGHGVGHPRGYHLKHQNLFFFFLGSIVPLSVSQMNSVGEYVLCIPRSGLQE